MGDTDVDEELLLRQHVAPTPERFALMNANTAVEWDRRTETGFWPKPATWEGKLETAEDVLSAFGVYGDLAQEFEGMVVIAAFYTYECYEGTAEVYYSDNGVLYEVHGSHCSCNGLEGQWSPEPVQADELRSRMLWIIDNKHRAPTGFAETVLLYLSQHK